jgi:hypothetical protein
MTIVWKDRRDVHILTNVHTPPAEGLYDEKGNAIKPHIIEEKNCHTGYVEKGDRMANSFSATTSGNG